MNNQIPGLWKNWDAVALAPEWDDVSESGASLLFTKAVGDGLPDRVHYLLKSEVISVSVPDSFTPNAVTIVTSTLPPSAAISLHVSKTTVGGATMADGAAMAAAINALL